MMFLKDVFNLEKISMSEINNNSPNLNKPILDGLGASIEGEQRKSNRERLAIGVAMAIGATAVAGSIFTGDASHFEITKSMPFNPLAQQFMNSLDGYLAKFGEVSFPTVLAGIGLTKIFANKNSKLDFIDKISSKEMVSESVHKESFLKKVLQNSFAGRAAILAAIGVTLASFSVSVGNEVTNGPERPIVALMDKIPGDTLITESAQAQPMLDGQLSSSLVGRIEENAQSKGINAVAFTKNLGEITLKNGETYNTLEFGFETPKTSKIYWTVTDGCTNIPVYVDRAARIPLNSNISIDGVSAIATGEINGFSAIGREGVEMSDQVMKDCIQKNINAPDYAVVLDTSPNEAKQILDESNTNHEAATIITKSQYLKNSLKFWEGNVKPITNTLALFSGLFAFVAMGASMAGRLTRNKRELAAMSASGINNGVIRASEILRAAKDSVIATIVGGSISLVTPFIVNSLEAGFKAGIGLEELAVGAAVGTIGCIGGVIKPLIRIKKNIDVTENTRVS